MSGRVSERVENIAGKSKDTIYKYSLHFPTMFLKSSISWTLNLWIDLTLSLLLTKQEAFVDSVDQDQTAQMVQSDL